MDCSLVNCSVVVKTTCAEMALVIFQNKYSYIHIYSVKEL